MIIDDSSDSFWILEIGSPRKKTVARMEASEAEEDDGASVFERAAGVYEPALLEDPSGGAAAHPSAKEVFDNLVREQCAKVNVNCWRGRRRRLIAASHTWMVGKIWRVGRGWSVLARVTGISPPNRTGG